MSTYLQNPDLNFNFNIEPHLSHRQMTKVSDLLESLSRTYQEFSTQESLPPLHTLRIRSNKGEGFTLSYYKKMFHLEADSVIGAMYGLAHLKICAKSGYLKNWLGRSEPRHQWRPLWLEGDTFFSLSAEMGLFLPAFFGSVDSSDLTQHPRFKQLCIQLFEYGYNSIVLGAFQAEKYTENSTTSISCQALCEAFQAYGIKVIIKPTFFFLNASNSSFCLCPLDSAYQANLKSLLEKVNRWGCQGFIWDSLYYQPQFLHHEAASLHSTLELILQDLKNIEETLHPSIQVFYYLSALDSERAHQYARWLPDLCRSAGNQTILMFPGFISAKSAYLERPHPIWECLRKLPRLSETPLLPIYQIGSDVQGGGLWPVIYADTIIDMFIRSCDPAVFAGVTILTKRLPSEKGFLSANLWMAGQALWKLDSADLLLDAWFRTYRPELIFSDFKGVLKKLTVIAKESVFLRSFVSEKCRDHLSAEACKIKVEALLAQLQEVQFFLNQEKDLFSASLSKTNFTEYFIYFYRDIRRILLHALQCYNIPFSSLITGEDLQDSFWTTASQGTGSGIRKGIKIIFLDVPLKGEEESDMRLIYNENVFL